MSQEQARVDTAAAASVTTVLRARNAGGAVRSCLSQSKETLHLGFADNCTGKAIIKALKTTVG